MEDEEPPNQEPPVIRFSCLLIICIFIPLFFLYPLKACLGIFALYAMQVGYLEDKKKKSKYRLKQRLKTLKRASSLEDL